MYEPNTILELKEKKGFAYDEVRVIGTSPVSHTDPGGQWEGGAAQGVIIEPLTEFGSNLDEPLGKLQALYTVKEVPDNTVTERTVTKYDATTSAAGPTPEEVFADKAPGEASKDGKRVRTPHESPLDDPRPKSASPLDKE